MGEKQSAGELRFPLSRYGFAFAPNSTPLVNLGLPDPPYSGRLSLLAIQKEGLSPPRSAEKKENALAGLPGRP